MQSGAIFDAWSAGQSYDQYMGRWSHLIAARFLGWLGPPFGTDWLEVGCGTGALTSAILSRCAPRSIVAVDASDEFVDHARAALPDPRVWFDTARADALPAADQSVDVVTSGLVLNFVPDREAALAEMQRVLRPGGLLSFYVWDYPSGGIGFVDAFWKAAAALDPSAAELDEALRFPFCTVAQLKALCVRAGLREVQIAPIEIEAAFPDFEAFWHPFTLGAGPAPGYCMRLPEDRRAALRARLASELGSDRPIALTARAWAIKTRIALD